MDRRRCSKVLRMRIVTSFSHTLWAVILVASLALGCSCPQPASTTTPHAGGTTGEPATPTTDEPTTPSPDREPAPGTGEPGSGEPTEQPADPGEPTEQPEPTGQGEPAADQLPGRGVPCLEGGVCAKGLMCLEYYGIAGARGPKFTSCETPCRAGSSCPDGLTCITIADGPGQVCRPR